MASDYPNWREGQFIVGATYRVIRENNNGRIFKVGEEWVFWYNTYSSYDGLGFVFFVSPASFYPAAGVPMPTDLKEADSVGWEIEDLSLMDRWYEYWVLVEAPRPGRMWVIEAFNKMRGVAEAQYQDRLKYTDERTPGPQTPQTPIWEPLKPKKPKK